MDRPRPSPPRRARARGFALIEVLVAATVLVVALLGYAASVTAGHRLNVATEERGVALETLAKFVERLRADSDWGGLYARLKTRSTESTGDTGLTWLKPDGTLAAYTGTSYYSDFTTPTTLGVVTFLVQVPKKTVDAVPALREDLVAPRYGLPADLNGDGTVDGAVRDTDYRALPVVVRMRWRRAAQASKEVVVATWLRGDR